MHGGATLKGREHPRYTSGKRSRYAPPAPIREGYERALADPMLHNLRDELALLDAILQDQLDEYEAGLSGDLWRQVQQAAGRSLDDLTRIGAAMQSSPPDAQAFRQSYSDLQVNLGEVMRLATRGRDIPGVRTEIGGTIDRIARVADKGQTIAIRDRMVMSFDTAYQIFDQFWTDVRLEIHDPDTIRSLGQILNRILEGVEQAQQLPGE